MSRITYKVVWDQSNTHGFFKYSNSILKIKQEVSNFGKSINENEDGIISFLGFWKAGDEVHTYFVPFPLGNRQRLKSTSRSLMFDPIATTNITFGNKFTNDSLHPSPPKSLAYILVHFC